MALSAPTYSASGLQTEIDGYLAALEDQQWETARVRLDRAIGVHAALAAQVSAGELNVSRQDLEALEKRLDKSIEQANRDAARSNGRLGIGRTNFAPRARW